MHGATSPFSCAWAASCCKLVCCPLRQPKYGLSILPYLASILGALNFLREWVKDLQDIHGDRAANHRTMASRLSPTQNRVGLMVGASLTTAFSLGWMAWQAAHWGCLVGTAVAGVACTWLAFRGNHRRLSAWMKLWMGLLFWPLL